VSGEAYEVTGTEWVAFNKKALKMSPESYAKIKALILKLCKKSNQCNLDELQTQMANIESQLN